MNSMKISIITINFNNLEGLKKTIESVINQTYSNIEYIVIDGGSTDGSVEVIKEYNDEITYWVFEKDKGIYNAMNKGIMHAEGEYLLMLNSGDTLYKKETLEKIIGFGLNKDIIYGNVLWVEKDNEFLGTFPSIPRFSYFLNSSLSHQATLIKRSLHATVGLYNECYKIISDWCFFMETLFKHNCTFQHIPLVMSKCDRDGISCINENLALIADERRHFIESKFPLYVKDYEELSYLKNEISKLKPNKFHKRIFKIVKRRLKLLSKKIYSGIALFKNK